MASSSSSPAASSSSSPAAASSSSSPAAAASSSSPAAALARVERPSVELDARRGELKSIILRQPGGYSAEILYYGGQVISWKNEQGAEMLFLSKDAKFEPPNPVRGGIPICFPKFYNVGNIEHHGFARIRFWKIDDSAKDDPAFPPPNPDTNAAFVDLIMVPIPEDFTDWPNRFELRLRVILGPKGDLTMTSRIRNLNKNGNPFTVPFSFHTYFSISDISEIRIEGLDEVDYLDLLQNKKRFTAQGVSVTFDDESEMDRVYLTPDDVLVAVMDHGIKRTYLIKKTGLPDLVVWNPMADENKATSMSDRINRWIFRSPLPNKSEYKKMLCVEAAALENQITLKPFQEWTGTQILAVDSSTYSEELPQPGICKLKLKSPLF